jgi:hypothetical protein
MSEIWKNPLSINDEVTSLLRSALIEEARGEAIIF